MPQPSTEAPHLMLASVVALSAWVLLPALTTVQLVLSAQSASADAESSRSATNVSSGALASQLRESLVHDAQRSSIELAMLGLAVAAALIGVVAVVVA